MEPVVGLPAIGWVPLPFTVSYRFLGALLPFLFWGTVPLLK